MNLKDLQIKESDSASIPLELLLSSDPSISSINTYLRGGKVITAEINGIIIGVCVTCRIKTDTLEIKNIAVDHAYQGNGIGSRLLLNAIEGAKITGAKQIKIATGNSSIGQLYLYQKVGFRITGVEKGYFLKHYSEPIFENNLQCMDLVILTQEL